MTTGTSAVSPAAASWVPVCSLDDLARERGSAALVEGTQVALFRTFDDSVYAVQQLDPYSGAQVMSRGIVGTRGDVPTVAGPMYKQVFDLRTGECLDTVGRTPHALRTYAVQVLDDVVSVRLQEGAGPDPAGAPRTSVVAGASHSPVVPAATHDPVAPAP